MASIRLTSDLYHYVDASGRVEFPSVDSICSNAKQGIVTLLVLDANVCMEVSNYARGQKDSEVDFHTRHFLLAVELVKVDVSPFLGCMELASKKNDKQLNLVKLSQFATSVSTALSQDKGSLANGKLPVFSEPYEASESTSLEALYPLLRYFIALF